MPRNSPPYDRLSAFISPATNSSEIWRTCAGVLGIAALYLFLAWNFAAAVWPMIEGTTGRPSSTLLRLINVALMGVAVVVITRALHQRSAASLFGAPGLALAQFLRVLTLQAPVVIGIGLIMIATSSFDMLPKTPFAVWLGLLPFGVLAILLQSGAEELAFRGYLLQQLAARSKHPVIWMGLPSALFAAAHFAPGFYGGNALIVVVWAGCFGAALADLTARSGTLGPAIAVHVTVNSWSLLASALPGDLSGLALYVLPFGPEDESAFASLLPAEFLAIAISWLAARLALRL